MLAKLRLVLSITIIFLSFYGSAQSKYWGQEREPTKIVSPSLSNPDLTKVKVFQLDQASLSRELSSISTRKKTNGIVYFPDIKGKLRGFRISEKAVFSPELAKKYPEIKSYSGYSLDGKKDRIRFSISHRGVQSMIVHAGSERTTFMEKALDGGSTYVVYDRSLHSKLDSEFICFTESAIEKSINGAVSKLVDDQTLKKYRIAISATGEYTQFHGGTIADALAAINATLTRVNQVFETDLGVTLELIANTDLVIFTDPDTDPYGGNLNSEVQNTLTSTIGEANYDVGHLFHEDTDGGNAGFIGSVCRDNQKGSAYAAALNPQGDIFDLDFVSHELGHQFGANHTWSFESEGTLVQAEPGTGTTIMGYAGIVPGENVAPNGDDYFHYYSIFQIVEYLQTTSCGEITPLANNPPVINPIGDYIIPKGTPFVLKGNATDPDSTDVLTYAWEQIDDGIVTTANFGPDNPSGANFRSLRPTTDTERYFPKLSEVILGNLTQTNPPINSAWETVSTVEREMNFALTVRDNAAGGGQVASELVKLDVINSAGPFVVTSQNTAETYIAGSVQTINWDVANTNIAPINTQEVDIFLSTDGGLSFPILVAADVPNDGTHDVIIPGNSTTTARFMVKGSENVFFSINTSDFVIEDSEVILNFADLNYDVCEPSDLTVPFIYETYLGFNEEVTFSALGMPPGLIAVFTPETAVDNNTPVSVTFSNTDLVATGEYPVNITATSLSLTKDVTLNITISDANFPDVVLQAPVDTATEVGLQQQLIWELDSQYSAYDIEIASDALFTSIIESASDIIFNSYLPQNLQEETTYFWRVKPKNSCGEGNFGPPFSFTTITISCDIETAKDLPVEISSIGTPTVTSKITILNDLPVTDVNVGLDLEHTFLADLIISITSPQGTKVILTSNSCGELENIDAVFDDEGDPFVCSSGGVAISGTVSPLGSLATFNGESSFGEWILTVSDTAPADGGTINNFFLEICGEGELRPDDDEDGVFDDGDDLCLGTAPGTEVNADGCPVFRFDRDNFNLEIESESCITNNDGSFEITAVMSMDYTVDVLGNGLNITEDFLKVYSLENLAAGTYSVCINGTDGINTFEEICFDVVINEPEPLGVISLVSIDGQQTILTLSGAQLYNIELNGSLIQTEAPEIVLDLKQGLNTLKVSTDLPCQGTYDETVFIPAVPVIYPNPVLETLNIFLGEAAAPVEITIFASDGRLIRSQKYDGVAGTITLDFIGLPSGLYYVNVTGGIRNGTYKILKR
jgi:subtilisin-like proprotein convertase family protein